MAGLPELARALAETDSAVPAPEAAATEPEIALFDRPAAVPACGEEVEASTEITIARATIAAAATIVLNSGNR
jgi:hypothetical protein